MDVPDEPYRRGHLTSLLIDGAQALEYIPAMRVNSTMTRRFAFPVLILAAFVLASAPASAQAQNKITLTPEIKQRLIDAPPLKGDGVTRETFNGKPVLVTFFASW